MIVLEAIIAVGLVITIMEAAKAHAYKKYEQSQEKKREDQT